MADVLKDVRWIDLPSVDDPRGILTAIEGGQSIPFEIKRIFYMHHIIKDRGGHAHRNTDQVATAIHGSCVMKVSDGKNFAEYEMNDPTKGLYLPRMIFTEMYNFSEGAVCLVLASTHYEMKQSIRTWEDYLKAINE